MRKEHLLLQGLGLGLCACFFWVPADATLQTVAQAIYLGFGVTALFLTALMKKGA